MRLPDDYISLLKLSDGFSVNGLNLYSSNTQDEPYYLPGLIETNLLFWQETELKKYIAFGEENSYRLVFATDKQKYVCVDRVTWEPIQEFNELFELLNFVLVEACILE